MLIILGGLPGAGKTTIARALAHRLKAVHLRVDTVEQALRSCGLLSGHVGPAGYVVAYRIAEDNLRVGQIVVADSVNSLRVTRDAWLSVGKRASARIAEVEVICSDEAEHRRRVETRTSDIDELTLPTWQDVVERKYEPWHRSPIVIDTAGKRADENVTDLIARLDLSELRGP